MATNTTITQTALPDWYTQYAKTLLEKAYGATGQPYQTYDAARVAGFAPEQEQAFRMVEQNAGAWRPALDAATASAASGVRNWTDEGVADSYMSPYVDNVVNDIGTLAARNLTEKMLPGVNRTFIGGGTFGGSRSEEFTARAIRDANESALREQNLAMQSGYNQAADTFGSDASRALQGAQVQAGLGSTVSQLGGRDAAALEAVGAQRQALAQRSADTAYADFERQRDYDLSMAERLGGIGGTPSPTGAGTRTETAPGPNKTASTIGTIIGGIGTLGGLFGKAEGGVVRRAHGGRVRRARGGIGAMA